MIARRAAAQITDGGPPAAPSRPKLTTAIVAITAIALLVLPLLVDEIALRRTASLIVLTLAVLGVVVATGYAGLISLGHGAFVGLGAFAMGAFLDLVDLPIIPAIVATFVLCWVVGWLLGLPALRIRGIYLALLTLGLGVVFPSLAKRFPAITGGGSGRPIDKTLQAPEWLGAENTVAYRYFFCLAVCVLMFWLTANVLRGRMGRAIMAVRDDETSAATFGVDLVPTKAGAFALSAALAGTAGSLQAILFPFVSHEQFDVFLSFRLYAAAVIGGAAYLMGAVYGVIALIVVPAINGVFNVFDNDAFVFGVGLIVLTFVSPDGIAGWLRRSGRA